MSIKALQELVGRAHVDQSFKHGLILRPGCTLLASGFLEQLNEKERGVVIDASRTVKCFEPEEQLSGFAQVLVEKFGLNLPDCLKSR